MTDEGQIAELIDISKQEPVAIFKHSTRCSISSMAKNRLDREPEALNMKFYLLDLLKYRNISNKVAEQFSVHHESPQILLIKNGECTYEESHNGIDMFDILQEAGIK